MVPGELYWADLPPANGHAQAGLRPVMVLQDDGPGRPLPTVLIVPLTRTQAATRFAGTVFLPASAANNLPADSVLLVFQLRALDRRQFRRPIGAVEPTILALVYEALDRLTGHP